MWQLVWVVVSCVDAHASKLDDLRQAQSGVCLARMIVYVCIFESTENTVLDLCVLLLNRLRHTDIRGMGQLLPC